MRSWVILAAVWAVSCSQTPAPEREEKAARPAAAAGPADDRPIIAAFGDSLTAGPGVDPAQNYPALLQKQLDATGHQYRVVNLGISGDTTGGGLARLSDVLELRPRFVIVELGANDGLRGLPVELTRSNLDQIVEGFKAPGRASCWRA